MERGSHVEGASIGHDFLYGHGIPELTCEKSAMLPIQQGIGMTETEVVVGFVCASSEVAFNEGFAFGAQDVGAGDGKVETGGNGEHVHVPSVVDVDARKWVFVDGLGIEKHHLLTTAYHLSAIGIEMRVYEAVPLQMPWGIVGNCFSLYMSRKEK